MQNIELVQESLTAFMSIEGATSCASVGVLKRDHSFEGPMRKQSAFVILAVLLISVVLPGFANAKDLSNRIGIGYKNQFTSEMPGVAAQYYPSADLGLSAALGVDTQKDNSKFGMMVKLYRVIFNEDNLNFYMGAGTGLISQQTQAQTSESGFELNGFGGAEFFFTGLDSLGFTFEAGISITSLSSGVRFRTYGDSPLRAGMIFYF